MRRDWLARRSLKRLHDSTVRMQSRVRSKLTQRQFQHLRQATIMLQKRFRKRHSQINQNDLGNAHNAGSPTLAGPILPISLCHGNSDYYHFDHLESETHQDTPHQTLPVLRLSSTFSGDFLESTPGSPPYLYDQHFSESPSENMLAESWNTI